MRAFFTPVLGIMLLALTTSAIAGRIAPTGESPIKGSKHLVSYSTQQDFESVKSALGEAIIEKGLVINNTSHIGAMLDRTGSAVGAAAKQIFLKAEAYEFCSASVSRLTMEADPHNIVFCPYIITVYVLPNEPSKTYLSFRKPDLVGSKASKAALKEVEKLLRSIIEEAIQ